MNRTIIIKIIIITDKTFTFSGLVRLREKCVLLLIGEESEHEIVPNLSHTNIHTMCAHCCCCHRYQHTTLYASNPGATSTRRARRRKGKIERRKNTQCNSVIPRWTENGSIFKSLPRNSASFRSFSVQTHPSRSSAALHPPNRPSSLIFHSLGLGLAFPYLHRKLPFCTHTP